MDISIIMAYYNRRNLLIKTLESISTTQFKGLFEVVIVDDGSNADNKITDLPDLFPNLNFKIIVINKKDKWWINPCIPNNIGFGIAGGNIFIIQNPECLHIGDILSYTANNISSNKYLVYACYAVDQEKMNIISRLPGSAAPELNKSIRPTNDIPLDECPYMNRWYQHSIFSKRCLNFCTAITRADLEDLGGFDEAFAYGLACDDTEFVYRIERKHMNVTMIDSPFVIHQWHPYTDYSNKKLIEVNHNLRIKTLNGNTYKVHNPRTKELIESIIKNNG